MSNSSGSNTISPSSGNLLRITGLNSGLDVDATVKKLMKAEQSKIDKANQEKQLLQWKQTAYQDIISGFKDLQNSFFDVSSSDTNILSSNTYAPFNVYSGDNSLSIIGSATAGTGAIAGNYSMKVTQTAAGAGFIPTLTGATNITLDSKLTDITSGAGAIGVGDAKANLSLVLKVNEGQLDAKNLNITLDNSGGTKTVKDLVNAINAQGNGAVKAVYSEVTKKLFLTTTSTGSTQTLKIDAASSTALKQLFDNSAGAQVTGADAKFNIKAPGEAAFSAEITRTTNNFTLDGINYSLTGTTDVAQSVSFTVAQDPDKVCDKIKTFIDKYNALVSKIQTKLTEKKNNDYKPLTEEQKDAMTTDQVNAWNVKAQAGVLRNDNNLKKILNDLQSAFSSPVTGANLSIGQYGSSSIGLDTSSGLDKVGQIRITDATKLKNAIGNNIDEFMKLFTSTSSITLTSASTQQQKTDYFNQSGVFTRIQEILQNNIGRTGTTSNSAILTKYANYQDNYSTYSGGLNTLPDQLFSKDAQIKDLQKRYTNLQTKYYDQFSKLETALTQMDAQSSSLTSMMGG